jgi:hypothetical protein
MSDPNTAGMRLLAKSRCRVDTSREPDEKSPGHILCQVYKFRSVWRKNISVESVTLCMVGGLLLIICSEEAERNGDELLIEGLPGWIRGLPQLVSEQYKSSRA